MPAQENKPDHILPEEQYGPLYLSILEKVSELLQNDIQALTQWMYHLDIDENIFRQSMKHSDLQQQAHEITLAMAARMERILQTREAYKKRGDSVVDNDPELAW